jgi:pyrroloquinoline quinone biosynthesis protein B
VLEAASGLRQPRKIFVHINNTNPILDEASPQFAEVQAAGWEVAKDGWTLGC